MAETYTAPVNPSFGIDQRRAIARAIIDHIQERSTKGKGIGGRAFSGPDGDNKYAKSYKDSREFETAGKSGSVVNLTLTGDMLASIEVLDVSTVAQVTVGFEEGEEDDKARFMRLKGYRFLGLSSEELATITSRFENSAQAQADNLSESIATSFLRSLLGG